MDHQLDHRLMRVVAEYPAALQPTKQFQPLGNAGGLSGSRLFCFESSCGMVVLRSWPSQMTASRLEKVHEWVVLAGNEIGCIATPFFTRDKSTFIPLDQNLFSLEPWKSGVSIQGQPSTKQIRESVEALGRFHKILQFHHRPGKSPGLLHRLQSLIGLRKGGISNLGLAIRDEPDEHLIGLAKEWVRHAREVLDDVITLVLGQREMVHMLQPCLRDCRSDHWLFQGERLNGLVDFGAVDLEFKEFDLARLMLDWWPDHESEELVIEYGRLHGLPEPDRVLVSVVEKSTALLSGANWIRWHFLERRQFAAGSDLKAGLSRSLRWMKSRLPIECSKP